MTSFLSFSNFIFFFYFFLSSVSTHVSSYFVSSDLCSFLEFISALFSFLKFICFIMYGKILYSNFHLFHNIFLLNFFCLVSFTDLSFFISQHRSWIVLAHVFVGHSFRDVFLMGICYCTYILPNFLKFLVSPFLSSFPRFLAHLFSRQIALTSK